MCTSANKKHNLQDFFFPVLVWNREENGKVSSYILCENFVFSVVIVVFFPFFFLSIFLFHSHSLVFFSASLLRPINVTHFILWLKYSAIESLALSIVQYCWLVCHANSRAIFSFCFAFYSLLSHFALLTRQLPHTRQLPWIGSRFFAQ